MKKGITLGFLLMLTFVLYAQEEEDYTIDSLEYKEIDTEPEEEITRGFMGDVHFVVGVPMGAFNESLERNAFGVGARILVDTKKYGSPVWAGVEFAYMGYGSSSTTIELQGGGFSEVYDLRINSAIVHMNGVLRYIPQWNSRLLPYVDGIIGTKIISTTTKIFEEDFGEEVQIDSETNELDWAFQYGIGTGILVRTEWVGRVRAYVDISVQFLRGTSADYLVRTESINAFEDPIDAYESRTTRTDMILPKIGLLLEIQ